MGPTENPADGLTWLLHAVTWRGLREHLTIAYKRIECHAENAVIFLNERSPSVRVTDTVHCSMRFLYNLTPADRT